MIDWKGITEFDLIILVIISLSGLLAMYKGFIASALALFGWIFSIAMSHYFFPYIEPFLRQKTSSDFIVIAIGYIGGLIAFLILMAIVNFIILTSLHSIRHGLLDKMLGLLFGIARGILLMCFFFFAFLAIASGISGKNIDDTDNLAPSFIQSSQSYKVLQYSKKYFLLILPNFLEKNLHNKDNKESNYIIMIAAIKKLAEYTEPNVLQRIQDEAKQYSSDSQVALATLQKLYTNYQQQYGKDSSEAPLSANEIADIEKMLQKK